MRTAVVVGAGVGGLAAAGALAHGGWHVTLIEKADRLRGNGGAQVVWPNGLAALHSLGLSLGDVTFPMPTGGIRRPDGRWLLQSAGPADDGTGEPVVVHADDLHDALMAGLGDRIEIRTSTEITTVRGADADHPAVGTGRHTFEADLIVAADGARSLIRRRLAPQSTVASAGYTAWRAVIPWFRAPQLPDAAGEMLGPGHRFVYAALGERGSSGGSTRGGIYWVATVPGALRPESPAAQLALLRRWFAEWQSPVGELLEATEPTDVIQQPGEDLRPLPRQFGIPIGPGGVVLLGDAAHVASPTLTQGACLAFEDAATLGIYMRSASPGTDLAQRLDEYTVARRARVDRVARASRRLGLLYQAQGRLAVKARDAALTRLSPRLLTRAASPHHWTPPT